MAGAGVSGEEFWEFGSRTSGTGTGMDDSIAQVQERERNGKKIYFIALNQLNWPKA